jgi:hypothetical protein
MARASLAAVIDGFWIRIQAGMSIVWSASELVLRSSDMLYDALDLKYSQFFSCLFFALVKQAEKKCTNF